MHSRGPRRLSDRAARYNRIRNLQRPRAASIEKTPRLETLRWFPPEHGAGAPWRVPGREEFGRARWLRITTLSERAPTEPVRRDRVPQYEPRGVSPNCCWPYIPPVNDQPRLRKCAIKWVSRQARWIGEPRSPALAPM